MLEKLDLSGRVAIVTGGGTNLGRAMSLALARAGADVALAARRRELIEEVAAEIETAGRRSLAVPTDVTDSASVERMVERVLSHFGQVDVLLNNAGIVRGEQPKPLWNITDDEWRLGIDTNLGGAFYCSRAVAKHMVERRKGKIINVASGFGLRGARNNFMYCCAKGGVIQLTKSLALTFAGDNIRVNAIVPGFFLQSDSPMAADAALARQMGAFIPVGRVGDPRELGPVAVFLASDACPYMTGEIIAVDGGGLAGGIAPTGLPARFRRGGAR